MDIRVVQPIALVVGASILLVVTAVITWSYYSNKRTRAILHQQGGAGKTFLLLFVTWALLISSVAGLWAQPQHVIYGDPPPVHKGDFVFLVDTSISMDSRPSPEEESQMETTKRLMMHIIDETPGARFMVFAYSRYAFSLSTMTSDRNELFDTIENNLHTDVIPYRGSMLSNALAAVADQKKNHEEFRHVSHVILFSDGVEERLGSRGDPLFPPMAETLELLNEAGISITTVGVGSEDGQPIPVFNDSGRIIDFYRVGDISGSTVVTTVVEGGVIQYRIARVTGGTIYRSFLNEPLMRSMAKITYGAYFSQDEEAGLVSYVHSQLSQDTYLSTNREVERTEDIRTVFYIPLLLGLFLLIGRKSVFY